MAARRIVIMQGHPDPAGGHFCHALADAYAEAATGAGNEVRRIEIATLVFPFLRTQAEFEHGTPPPAIAAAQDTMRWAEHWVLIWPLWIGDMPALFKAFLEQVSRPGFAFRYRPNRFPEKLLRGRSARLVVTMGMPALLYCWWYGAHALRTLKRHLFRLIGVRPVRATVIGSVGGLDAAKAAAWLERMRALGRDGR